MFARYVYVILLISNETMKNNQEFYEFIDDLVQELKRIGDEDAAEKLRLAKIGGSTGTEVFMELRYELENILATKSDLSVQYRRKAIEALKDINTALSR